MRYEEAVSYLDSLSRFGIRPGLERTWALLRSLGHPERALAAAHITGTNGKGSVAATLASVARAAGRHVGLYTSPHLWRYEERLQVDGVPVSPDCFADLIDETARAAARVGETPAGHPTQFEVLTAAAFLHFARVGVDLAVIEVGLGGRYDATNVLEAPLVTAIASIDLDHTEVLGRTTAEIASDKAGIVKPGAPLVVGSVDEPAWRVIRDAAGRAAAPVVRLYGPPGPGGGPSGGIDGLWVDHIRPDREGTAFDLRTPDRTYTGLKTALLGRHQAYNAALAVAMAEWLDRRGLRIGEDAIRRGLGAVRWPGRVEVVRESPAVVLDGAHNPAGATVLAAAVEDLFTSCRPRRLVLGVLADKDVAGVVGPLVRNLDMVVATTPRSPRALPAVRLAEYVRVANPAARVAAAESIETAVETALEGLGPGGLVVVAGSLYLVGPVRAHLLKSGL